MVTDDDSIATGDENQVEPSLADSLGANYDKQLDAENENIIENEGDPTSLDATPKATRDGKGRFTKKAEEVIDPAAVVVDPAQAVVDPAAVVADPAITAAPVEGQPPEGGYKPPQSWSPAAKEIFASLDPETQGALQEELTKREADYSKGIQRHAESAKSWDEISPAITPWLPYLNARKASPAVAFDALIRAEHALQMGTPQSKQAALLQLGKDYGIELPNGQPPAPAAIDPATGQPIAPSYDLASDPRYNELYKNFESLTKQVQDQQFARDQDTKRQHELEETQSLQMVREFSKNPEYPHFEVLRPRMQQLLELGAAEDLVSAYNQAAWDNPEVRTTLIENMNATRIKEQAEKALIAKGKKLGITGQPSGLEVKTPPSTIRGSLEENFDNLST